jgi:hypothetical protein
VKKTIATLSAAATTSARPVGPALIKTLSPEERRRILGEPPGRPSQASRRLGGLYRVIHGVVELPRPQAEIDADPSPTPALTIRAQVGDEIEIGDTDAANMLDADVIEPLDAKPSRVGKVWDPPKRPIDPPLGVQFHPWMEAGR